MHSVQNIKRFAYTFVHYDQNKNRSAYAFVHYDQSKKYSATPLSIFKIYDKGYTTNLNLFI